MNTIAAANSASTKENTMWYFYTTASIEIPHCTPKYEMKLQYEQ